MPRRHQWLLSMSAVLLLTIGLAQTAPSTRPATRAAAAPAAKVDPALAALWTDFNHYVRIARPDLAQAAAAALLGKVNDAQLLDLVESGDYPDYEQTLDRAARIDTLKEQASRMTQMIQQARIARARDTQRIEADIARLAEGERPRMNAMARLRAAGQYAAPQLLTALLDERRQKEQPYILAAMVQLGRPMVYPLSVALADLEPVPQGQIAQVLAEIGYPLALPYLKQVSESPRTNASARKIVDAAFRRLAKERAQDLPANVTAAELFLLLAQNSFTAASAGEVQAGFDQDSGKGLVWTYDRAAGLVPIQVPAPIHGDVLAMRASRRALELNPQMDAALSLWLMANSRRENRLPKGQADPSYPAGLQSPAFYLEMAGPLRQHDVLDRALRNNDPALALDAIAALSATAGTDALINRKGAQPLLRALSYPDRRVRFASAFTMANAHPRSEFPGNNRVVPVLGEAIRQSEARFAVVLGGDQNSVNSTVATAKELGYQPIGGLSLQEVASAVAAGPGVDLLIVVGQPAAQVAAIHDQTASDYKLAAVPIVALVSPADQIELNRRFGTDGRVRPSVVSEDRKDLKPVLEAASRAYAGAALTAEEAQQYAFTALGYLREIGMDSGSVYKAAEAQPALVAALHDKRTGVVTEAAGVLALLSSADAQRAIADAALDGGYAPEVRASLLNSLADSAIHWGNHLSGVQLDKVLELVKAGQGEVGAAAARAHGALSLPTSNVVQLIVK